MSLTSSDIGVKLRFKGGSADERADMVKVYMALNKVKLLFGCMRLRNLRYVPKVRYLLT